MNKSNSQYIYQRNMVILHSDTIFDSVTLTSIFKVHSCWP